MNTGNTTLDTKLYSINGTEVPRHVKKVMLDMQEKSGNIPDLDVFKKNSVAEKRIGGFDFSDCCRLQHNDTEVVVDWMAALHSGNFSSFDFLIENEPDPFEGKTKIEYMFDTYIRIKKKYIEQKRLVLEAQGELSKLAKEHDAIATELIDIINNA